jgi:hypothetical protein
MGDYHNVTQLISEIALPPTVIPGGAAGSHTVNGIELGDVLVNVTAVPLMNSFIPTVIAGGAAGAHTVTGIATTDSLIAVIEMASGTGPSTDLTSEFSITGANTIDNTGGTATTGDFLWVYYGDTDLMALDLTDEFVGSALGITAANTIVNTGGTDTTGYLLLVSYLDKDRHLDELPGWAAS